MRQRLGSNPHGSLVPTIENQQAFVPHPLPRELEISSRLVWLLDRASRASATLSGVGETVPNPLLIANPLIHREAVLSTRIEGTIASLSDVFSHQAARKPPATEDIREVINYVEALQLGIALLKELPISLRLVNQVHECLLAGVRGREKRPGEFRSTQVWIGSPGSSIKNARFIPPPPERLRELFYDWESFANQRLEMPPLVKCALMHYQIEAIHPYEDGNGRIGRLLIILYLISAKVLPFPLLYLSAYFERDRQRYYDELFNVSATGDWERWLDYFLTGVLQESQDVLARIRRLREMQGDYRDRLQARRVSSSALLLMDEFFANPIMTVRGASEKLGMSIAGARRVLDRLVEASLVRVLNATGARLYVAPEVLAALQDPDDEG